MTLTSSVSGFFGGRLLPGDERRDEQRRHYREQVFHDRVVGEEGA